MSPMYSPSWLSKTYIEMFLCTFSLTTGKSSTLRQFLGSQPDIIVGFVKYPELGKYHSLCLFMYMAQKRQKCSFYGSLCLLVKRHFTGVCRIKFSGITESEHPIGIIKNKTGKIVMFVIKLNLHFLLCDFLG